MAAILAVDDDPDVLEVIRATLAAAGHSVAVTRSAEDAARRLCLFSSGGHRLPDLVLLDLVMPKLDGLSLAARLRVDPIARGVPILLLTGRSDIGGYFGGVRNVVGALRKPFEPRELIRAVEDALYCTTRDSPGVRLPSTTNEYL